MTSFMKSSFRRTRPMRSRSLSWDVATARKMFEHALPLGGPGTAPDNDLTPPETNARCP
jgi:hypothetical protein